MCLCVNYGVKGWEKRMRRVKMDLKMEEEGNGLYNVLK